MTGAGTDRYRPRVRIAKPVATMGLGPAHARAAPNATICTASPAVSTDSLTAPNG
jgi:hypothetical protein